VALGGSTAPKVRFEGTRLHASKIRAPSPPTSDAGLPASGASALRELLPSLWADVSVRPREDLARATHPRRCTLWLSVDWVCQKP
jgi:hypothetical protein